MAAFGSLPTTLNDMDAETVGQCFSTKCDGKFVVITGASVGGLGFETARVLAKFGAEVFLCCRTQEECDVAVQTLRDTNYCNNIIRSAPLDLASFLSIQRCAYTIIALNKPVDILINAATTKEVETKLSEDGFELQWQINYLGPFYFTDLLFPLLIRAGKVRDRPARVLNLSSIMQYVYCADEGLDFNAMFESDDHQNILATKKDAVRWYAESKLAMIMFAKEISKQMRVEEDPDEDEEEYDPAFPKVIGVCLYPGVIPSTRVNHAISPAKTIGLAMKVIAAGKTKVLRQEKHKTVAQGAATIVYCALHPTVRAGEHYADCALSNLVHDQANDESSWAKLWEASQFQIQKRLKRIHEVQQSVERILSSDRPTSVSSTGTGSRRTNST